MIVDEFTGRLAEGRKWRDGIHQAVEAKEGVEVTVDTGQAARITVQDFFLRYEHLAGMTGTAMALGPRAAQDLHAATWCRSPPTGRRSASGCPTAVFGTADAKWAGRRRGDLPSCTPQGRPVLIGTRSIDKSEHLSQAARRERGIEHQVLNAHHIAEEAEIVARAGQPRQGDRLDQHGRPRHRHQARRGRRRAGRAARHLHRDARRRPASTASLIGRCGRQGDPGTYRQYLALDDDLLLAGLGPKKSREATRRWARSPTARSTGSAGCSARPSGRSSAATSATASR